MGGEDTAPLIGGEQQQPEPLAPPQYNAPPPQQYIPPQPYPPPQTYPQPYSPYPPQYQQPYQPTGYQQGVPPGTTPLGAPMGTAYVPPVVLAQDVRFRDIPVVCTCTFCGNNGPTRVEFVPGLLTWLAAGGICLVGCWLGCCLIPFALDDCKDVEHHCSACQRVIGVYKRVN